MQIPTKSVPNPILDRVHEGRHRGRYGTAIASHSIFDILTYPNGVGFTLSIDETWAATTNTSQIVPSYFCKNTLIRFLFADSQNCYTSTCIQDSLSLEPLLQSFHSLNPQNCKSTILECFCHAKQHEPQHALHLHRDRQSHLRKRKNVTWNAAKQNYHSCSERESAQPLLHFG